MVQFVGLFVVQLVSVHQQFGSSVQWFVRVVQFSQSVSRNSSAAHGSCGLFGSPCRSVAGSVSSVVQSVYTVCIIAVADQYSPAQITKHVSRYN